MYGIELKELFTTTELEKQRLFENDTTGYVEDTINVYGSNLVRLVNAYTKQVIDNIGIVKVNNYNYTRVPVKDCRYRYDIDMTELNSSSAIYGIEVAAHIIVNQIKTDFKGRVGIQGVEINIDNIELTTRITKDGTKRIMKLGFNIKEHNFYTEN